MAGVLGQKGSKWLQVAGVITIEPKIAPSGMEYVRMSCRIAETKLAWPSTPSGQKLLWQVSRVNPSVTASKSKQMAPGGLTSRSCGMPVE